MTTDLTTKEQEQRRVLRYALQGAVSELLPDSRTAKVCFRKMSNPNVALFLSPQFGSVHFGGLQVCGSLWVCPLCSAKITERRRKEVDFAISEHRKAGGELIMVTRTVPHSYGSELSEQVNRFLAAERFLKMGSPYKRLIERLAVIGSIRVLEVTHGVNGWHVHSHELVFLEKDTQTLYHDFSGLSYDDVFKVYDVTDSRGLFPQWVRAATKAQFSQPSVYAFNLHNGDYAANYIAKWGHEPLKPIWTADFEITKSHLKTSTKTHKGFTPFDLLTNYFLYHDEYSGLLFKEFAEVFHGKHQLQFSTSLKKRYALDLKDDATLAVEPCESAVELGGFSYVDWQKILKHNLRANVLNMVMRSGFDVTFSYVNSLH